MMTALLEPPSYLHASMMWKHGPPMDAFCEGPTETPEWGVLSTNRACACELYRLTCTLVDARGNTCETVPHAS